MTGKKIFFGISIVVNCLIIVFMNMVSASKSYGLEGDEVFSYISAHQQVVLKKFVFWMTRHGMRIFILRMH